MASFEPQDFGLDDPPPRPTTPPVRRVFLLVLLALCLAAGLVYGIPYVAERTGYAWESGRSKAASEALLKLDKAGVVSNASALFRMATVAVSPAVVNIQTQRFRREGAVPGMPLGGGANRFGRGNLESFGIGSGVVIDRDRGFVVTNNHVIQGADQITVRLSQGAEVAARLVGADPKSDLAVLQVRTSLKVAAEWGDSDKLAVGDWVLAIGSPFMLDHTVTAGIVSATGRNNLALPGMEEGAYQDFVQTDAAINPGNSGGPLVDLNGKVVGINTAILTGATFRGGEGVSGGFEGIGLAIPAAMARRVVDALIKDGKVERGFLGVRLQPLNEQLAKQLKTPDTRGALIAGVQPGSAADHAGLKTGDVIVKLDGKEVNDPNALRNRVAEIAPGSEIPVEYLRGGTKDSVRVVVGRLGGEAVPVLTPFGFGVGELPPGEQGGPLGAVVVNELVKGSPAARSGLRLGVKLKTVGGTEVHTREEFEKATARFNPARGLPLELELPDGTTVPVTIGGNAGPR